jgi:hypothetical protein
MQFELLSVVIDALDAADIPHMVAGSMASAYHGEPRATQDIDLVIDPTLESIRLFVDSLDRDRYYTDNAVLAVERHDMFNVIEPSSGWKVDLIIKKTRPFSSEEFDRRRKATLGGVGVYIATLEDTILAKLEWMKMSNSRRQYHDVVNMLVVAGADVDDEYLDRWAPELNVVNELTQARREADDEGQQS